MRSATHHLVSGLSECHTGERLILQAARALRKPSSGQPDTAHLIADIEKIAESHLGAIEARIAELDSSWCPPASMGKIPEARKPSEALRKAYAIIHETIARYAALQPVAHRFGDSWVVADDGTAAHLARRHTQDWFGAVGRITGSLAVAVVAELDAEGIACRCTCPACSMGICLCATSSRLILDAAWKAGRPTRVVDDIEVPAPRATSAAARAGFRAGDVIVAIGRHEVDSIPALQSSIREHRLGEYLQFKVRRSGSDIVLVARRSVDLDVAPTENQDDCVQPAGQAFLEEQARNIRQTARESAPVTRNEDANVGKLSPREMQVLGLLAKGTTNPEIAAELEISRATVARHVANILDKLAVSNRTEAVALAARNPIVRDWLLDDAGRRRRVSK